VRKRLTTEVGLSGISKFSADLPERDFIVHQNRSEIADRGLDAARFVRHGSSLLSKPSPARLLDPLHANVQSPPGMAEVNSPNTAATN
jgi:hypothetical protein